MPSSRHRRTRVKHPLPTLVVLALCGRAHNDVALRLSSFGRKVCFTYGKGI